MVILKGKNSSKEMCRRDWDGGEVGTESGSGDIVFNCEVRDVLSQGIQGIGADTEVASSVGASYVFVPLLRVPSILEKLGVFFDVILMRHTNRTGLVLFVARDDRRHGLLFDMGCGVVDDMFFHLR